MFRLWGKEFKDNRMLRDIVICDETDDTRTHKTRTRYLTPWIRSAMNLI